MPVNPDMDIDGILCPKERRRVARDNTVQYRGRNLQLFPDADKVSYAGAYVEIQERLDGQILACYQDKILTPQDAPPLAARLRAQVKDLPAHPALWKEPPPPKPPRVRGYRKRKRVWVGPLENDRFWWKDPVEKIKHSELTKAGLEQARQAGQQIGVPPVEEREGFAEKFPLLLVQIEQNVITRRQAAKELGISANTFRRVLYDYYGRVPAESNKRPLLVAEGV